METLNLKVITVEMLPNVNNNQIKQRNLKNLPSQLSLYPLLYTFENKPYVLTRYKIIPLQGAKRVP